jgi:hypothetical protein
MHYSIEKRCKNPNKLPVITTTHETTLEDLTGFFKLLTLSPTAMIHKTTDNSEMVNRPLKNPGK